MNTKLLEEVQIDLCHLLARNQKWEKTIVMEVIDRHILSLEQAIENMAIKKCTVDNDLIHYYFLYNRFKWTLS